MIAILLLNSLKGGYPRSGPYMRADSAIPGLRRLDFVAVASCSAGKRRGLGHPSWRLMGLAIAVNLFKYENIN
jgi:hypothetical protein